ncbi:hypothetical protein QBC42DRAFT_272582 [Cladorrhinum samala]|uniref:TMEM205-like domain-containing protein n=1 Tax=Cladorrhinum samala TaxID=585594 RepID=A0AAV9HJJ9_9PEZI|nr:hypothetical protein QBC42DRAFT_272582 [Cladorrhinum samala]
MTISTLTHILSYSTLLGTTVFHTFIGGIVSYRVLPRSFFASLMSKIFPIYFGLQTALPVLMAVTYPASRNAFGFAGGLGGVRANGKGVIAPLGLSVVCGLANLVVVGPETTRCMDERRVQEKKDGKKAYDDPPHSEEMQALNKKFSILHGVSSLLNLGELVALVGYGVHLAGRIA